MTAIRLCHVITDLDTGGAETMLRGLLSHLDRTCFETEVISLTDIGPVGREVQALGIPVRALGMSRGTPNPLGVLRLSRWLRRSRPDVVHTWMYHANLVGGLAATLAGRGALTWGIYHTNLDRQSIKSRTLWTARVCKTLSPHLPAAIVCCAEATMRAHAELGYASDRMVVIPNGFDTRTFKPDPAARASVRRELEIPDEAPLIGMVGRFDRQKDHRTFLRAAAMLHARLPDAHFLLCGDQVTWRNPSLARCIDSASLRTRCHLLGWQADIPRLNAALDIASSSSYSEGLSLVIGEAMASGVPCVVTDVGDSGRLVADTGKVVPPKDPQALAEAWLVLIELGQEGRRSLGQAARRRIAERFGLPTIVSRYEQLYADVAAGVPASSVLLRE